MFRIALAPRNVMENQAMKTSLKKMPVVILCGWLVTIPALGAPQEVDPNHFDGAATVHKQKPVKRQQKLKEIRLQRAVKTDARRLVKKDLQAGNRQIFQPPTADKQK